MKAGTEKPDRMAQLELEPHSKLEEPRQFPHRVAGNCPEKRVRPIRTSYSRIRLPKAWVIGDVEHFRPHFQLHSFFGHERFVKVQIRIVDAVDAQAGKITRRVAGVLVSRVGKAVRVEKSWCVPVSRVLPIQCHGVHADAGLEL